jgi:F0F1-type ATP synthase membrane subunit c/vacuolar-type H+-ATPase subunit K
LFIFPNGLTGTIGKEEMVMDWMLVILIGIGLPIFGSIIGALMVHKKYIWLKENAHEFDMDEEELRKKNFGKYMVIQNLFGTGPLYGFLIVFMLYLSSIDLTIPEDTLSLFGLTVALGIGVPGAFSNISRGMIAQNALEAIVRDPASLGRGIVHITMVELPLIFGLLIAILSLQFSGLLQYEFWLSHSMVEDMFYAIVVFAIFSSGIILSGILLKKAKDPFSLEGFREGVILNGIGVIPSIIGLVYVIMKFVEIDLFLQGPPP